MVFMSANEPSMGKNTCSKGNITFSMDKNTFSLENITSSVGENTQQE